MTPSPVLAIYSPRRETELHTDASSHGFGGVLLQRQDDGRLHPVAYYSRRTSEAEAKYHSFVLETLAIIYSLKRFHVYLHGIPFRVVTDCNALAQTLDKRDLNPQIARWALEIGTYGCEVVHRSGVNMGHVDALSRNHPVAFIDIDDADSQLQITQNRDAEIVRVRDLLEAGTCDPFALCNGLVYRKDSDDRLLLYVPQEMEENVIRLTHEGFAHCGITKSVEQLRLRYWFPKMKAKVEQFIRNCLRCIMHSGPARANERNLHNIPKASVPFDTVHIDHYGPLPSVSSKRKHILAIIDGFTKHVQLYPVVSTGTKEVCCALLKYFEYYSRPRRIISDRGTSFTSGEFGAFLSERNIEHVKVAVASPQANGQIERVNRVLTSMLGKLTEPVQHADWTKMLGRVEYAINNSVHQTTECSPSELLFGVRQRGEEIDWLGEHLDDRTNERESDVRDLKGIRVKASAAIEKSQQRNLAYHRATHRPAKTFELGEFVVIKNVDTTVGKNKKFIPKFRGPYVVQKVLPNDRYVIRDIENYQVTQLPYDGVIESSHMRRWADHLGRDLDVNGGSNEQHYSDEEIPVDLDPDSEFCNCIFETDCARLR